MMKKAAIWLPFLFNDLKVVKVLKVLNDFKVVRVLKVAQPPIRRLR